MSKSKPFQIKKPSQPSEEVMKFALGAGSETPLPSQAPVEQAAEPKKYPWEAVDTKARGVQYNMNYPADLYAKMVFLRDNEPGGVSIRGLTLEALAIHVEQKLEKYK